MNKFVRNTVFALFLLALVVLAGCNQATNLEWRCNVVNCTQSVQLSGEEWAQQNCKITEQGTVCQVNFDNGQSQVVPLEQINISAIQATQCLQYTCIEEVPFRKSSYILNVTQNQ